MQCHRCCQCPPPTQSHVDSLPLLMKVLLTTLHMNTSMPRVLGSRGTLPLPVVWADKPRLCRNSSSPTAQHSNIIILGWSSRHTRSQMCQHALSPRRLSTIAASPRRLVTSRSSDLVKMRCTCMMLSYSEGLQLLRYYHSVHAPCVLCAV